MNSLGVDGHWLHVSSADPRARALQRRHYSAWKNPHPQNQRFVGPGEVMVLLLVTCDALFVWRLSRYRLDGQEGLECSVFRNESEILSSELIREADELAWSRWPGLRHFTYVDSARIRSVNPGACFKAAGWRRCGVSGRGLHLLERRREWGKT